MLTNSSLILNPFILPEVKDFSNLKPYDIINSGKLSQSEILIPYLSPRASFDFFLISQAFRSTKKLTYANCQVA